MKNRLLKYTTAFILILIVMQSAAYCQDADTTASKRKNPTGALFRSVFVPGWGQFYNEKYILQSEEVV